MFPPSRGWCRSACLAMQISLFLPFCEVVFNSECFALYLPHGHQGFVHASISLHIDTSWVIYFPKNIAASKQANQYSASILASPQAHKAVDSGLMLHSPFFQTFVDISK